MSRSSKGHRLGEDSIQLKHIYEEIELSKTILDLEDGWDGCEAPSIPHSVYNSSISFLKDYCQFILDNSGVAIDAPEINPGRRGNIFLSWRTQNGRLAISIEQRNEEVIANYYGVLENKLPIRGTTTTEFSEHLAYWMQNLV